MYINYLINFERRKPNHGWPIIVQMDSPPEYHKPNLERPSESYWIVPGTIDPRR